MKKIIAILLCSLVVNMACPMGVFAIDESSAVIEHVKLSKKLAKKTPTDIVRNDSENIILTQYNTLEVYYAQDFNAKSAKLGDEITYLFKDGVYTQEGTEVLPPATKLVASISNIEKPKSFNRSGKIYLDFKYIELPDGTRKDVRARIFGNKDFLSRGKLNALGKGLGSTLGGSAIGVAAGCGIGIAANAVIIGGFAIGMPIGFAVGAVAGLVTPGLNYKAKAGDKVVIQLTSDVDIEK